MSAIIRFKDLLTPALQRKLDQIADKRPILQAMGDAAVSIANLAFMDPAMRLSPWAPKKDGSTATLKSVPDPLLCKSLIALPPSEDMIEVGSDLLRLGSDRDYARAQNFGYAPRNLPARPFFPITQDGDVLEAAETAIAGAMAAAVEKALR